MRWLGVAVAFVILSVAAVPTGQAASPYAATTPSSRHSYDYDPLGPTTLRVSSANDRRIASIPHGFDSIRLEAGFGVAAKAGDDVAYHYTFREAVASIERSGLRPGSYATPNGRLSPLQAQIDLALPPNRGLTNAVLRVDLAGLRKAGYDIPRVSRVGRNSNMPGGGFELRFRYEIPPEYISVVRR